MPFAAVAGGVASAAVGAGISALTKDRQSGQISGAQEQANAVQTAAQERMRADLMPWIEGGTNALYNTQALSGAAGTEERWHQPVQNVASYLSGVEGPEAQAAAMQGFYTSPGYQFRLSEGLRGVDAGAAAHGMLRSGATLKAEDKFAQGLASDEFANYYTRANDQFGSYYNRLMDLSKLGESAAAGVGQSGVNTAAGIAATDVSAGTKQANLTGQLGSSLGTTANSLLNNASVQNAVSNWLKPSTSSGSSIGMSATGAPSLGADGVLYQSGGIF